jgi:ribosome-associated protein
VEDAVDVEENCCHQLATRRFRGVGAPKMKRSSGDPRTRSVAMDGESIRVTRSVVLPLAEIQLRFSRSSGPGGQHAQKSETRVEAVLDVEASAALSSAQKVRVVRRAGPVLRAVAQDERSQARNRELAVGRLVEQLREALRVERRRLPTKPTEAARRRRLEEKRRRAEVKRLRRNPG